MRSAAPTVCPYAGAASVNLDHSIHHAQHLEKQNKMMTEGVNKAFGINIFVTAYIQYEDPDRVTGVC